MQYRLMKKSLPFPYDALLMREEARSFAFARPLLDFMFDHPRVDTVAPFFESLLRDFGHQVHIPGLALAAAFGARRQARAQNLERIGKRQAQRWQLHGSSSVEH